jgi:Flp pilus assembly protein TadD
MIVTSFARVAAFALALMTSTGARTVQAQPVTYARDIAPLVFDRCVQCHQPGGPAPFSLLTYAAVRQRAGQIADVTKRRFMPPWKAEPESGSFVGQTPLTAAEIDLIQRWVQSGTPEGNPRDLPATPRLTAGWVLGQPDVIVDFPDSYTLPAEGTDVFRIFVLPLPIATARYVRGLEFRPGNARVVHHANIRLDRTAVSRARDADDPVPGYDGLLARTATYPDGHFLGWTPGQVVPLLDREFAWRLEPGTDLVIQLHMQPSGKPEAVRPSVGLFFAPAPAADAARRTPSILRLGDQGIDIAAGDSAYVINDSYVLPVDVDVLAVQPHAHYRARDIQGIATLPDGSRKWLIHIKDWDFRWQHVYRLIAPMRLPKGTTVAMQFTYDNSDMNARNPERPPARARWGQRSRDEMGDLWLQVQTRDARDRATLTAEVRRKMTAEDTVGYETMIREYPDDADLHDDVAVLYLELGKPDAAVTHFETSLRLRPDSAPAYFNVGTALAVAGRLEPARTALERALHLRPGYSAAHNNLGNVLAVMGRRDEAIRHFQEALRLDPNNAEARTSLERETRQQERPRP